MRERIIEINSPKWGTRKALIDIEDIEKAKLYTWQVKFTKDTNCFYVISSQPKKKEIKLHRYLTDCPDDKVIDHINRNPLDNRKSNLRICNQRSNSLNQWRKRNKSGCLGVRQMKSGKWNVQYCKKMLEHTRHLKKPLKQDEGLNKKIATIWLTAPPFPLSYQGHSRARTCT